MRQLETLRRLLKSRFGTARQTQTPPFPRYRSLTAAPLQRRMCLAAMLDGPPQVGDVAKSDPLPVVHTAEPEALTNVSVNLQPLVAATSINEWTDRVALAGEGIGSLRVSPTGELGQLHYVDQMLYYRSRLPGEGFVEQRVAEVDDYLFVTPPLSVPAQLLYRRDGTPVVLVARTLGFEVHRRDADGIWGVAETVDYEPDQLFERTGNLVAEIGSDDAIHVILAAGDWFAGRLLYATNRTGSWEVTEIADVAAAGAYFHFGGLASRYLSMAVAVDHSVHVAYTPEFLDFGEGGFRRPFDQLGYLSNRSGQWQAEIVHQPADDSGQSGLASSIAIAPDGQPAIAQFFVDRYPTGSAVSSRLLYHRRLADGGWSSETVADRAAGYVAGDGDRFTGFAPHLVFDAFERPHIAFSDHASQHFPDFGADEFAGQIRHAVKQGDDWVIGTVFAQSDPLRQMIAYPTMAILPSEIVFVGIQRTDELGDDFAIIDSSTNYVEAVIPQTGLTLQPMQQSVRGGETAEVVLRRHHADLAGDAVVQLRSSVPSLIAPRSYTIPAGSDRMTVEIGVGFVDPLDESTVIELDVSGAGFYPGATILTVDPARPWQHNLDLMHDVNGDGRVTPLDALVVINWLAVAGTSVGAGPSEKLRFPDVNADDQVTPLDALRVINFLARPNELAAEPAGTIERIDAAWRLKGTQLDAGIESPLW